MISRDVLDILLCRCGNDYNYELQYLFCSACGCRIQIIDDIFLFPLVSNSQQDEVKQRDIQAKEWREKLSDESEKWTNINYKSEIRAVVKALDVQANDTVLDVGAGAGRIFREIYESCGLIIAIDFSIECLRVLREITKGSDNIIAIRGNAAEMKFKAATVDKIICTQVIQHIKHKHELENAIEAMSKVLMRPRVPRSLTVVRV